LRTIVERNLNWRRVVPEGWEWDATLFQGSARYYVQGRPPYAPGLADQIADALSLDGTGRLLDVGCGPGVVTLALAHLFAEVIGVDPDAEMLAEAQRRAEVAGIANLRWVQARAEELPLDLGTFRSATFAQSFHWMDRPRVAAIVYDMLEPGGALVHISDAKTSRSDTVALPFPTPPYAEMQQLVERYLGSVRRAGQGFLRNGTPGDEASVLTEAGFLDPERIIVPATEPFIRDIDDIVAWVYSRSNSAPHLFGDRRKQFELDLRQLLDQAAPNGRFADQPSDTEVFIWRKGRK
jgi:ubiquinone/menaquinone biosynthesis C-methylase UbiE